MTDNTYDTIVIGAGIAGASTAYFLRQKGQRVLVVDRDGIASGGSGAAGAFISPKVGKGGSLQQLTNEAFAFAVRFYLDSFPTLFHQTGVIRIPRDEKDAEQFTVYEPYNQNNYTRIDPETARKQGVKLPYESFLFDEAGACDAPQLCEALLDGIDIARLEVASIEQTPVGWETDGCKAKNIVLATGYKNSLFDMRYMGVHGRWGNRGDFVSALPLAVSMHQSMSISANIDGIIRLGATYELQIKEPTACDDKQALGLRELAGRSVDTTDFELSQTYCGMRSGSKDYAPLTGKVVDVPWMLEQHPNLSKGARAPLKYIDNLYICNGLGGRGFVMAPYLANTLASHIIQGSPLDSRADPDRLFLKWCRREL